MYFITVALLASCLIFSAPPIKAAEYTYEGLIDGLENTLAEVTKDFEATIKHFFYDVQDQMDRIINSSESEGSEIDSAYIVKKMSNEIALVESVRYAAQKRALQVAEQIVTEVIGIPKLEIDDGNAIQVKLLETRILLRALMDGLFYSIETWKTLHKLIGLGNKKDLSDPVTKFGVELYLLRKGYDKPLYKLFHDQEKLVDQYIQTRPDESLDEDLVLEEMDETIEDGVGCSLCINTDVDDDRLYLKPIFDSESDIASTVEELVDPKLLKDIRASNAKVNGHVRTFDVDELLALDNMDIEDQSEDYLAEYKKSEQ